MKHLKRWAQQFKKFPGEHRSALPFMILHTLVYRYPRPGRSHH